MSVSSEVMEIASVCVSLLRTTSGKLNIPRGLLMTLFDSNIYFLSVNTLTFPSYTLWVKQHRLSFDLTHCKLLESTPRRHSSTSLSFTLCSMFNLTLMETGNKDHSSVGFKLMFSFSLMILFSVSCDMRQQNNKASNGLPVHSQTWPNAFHCLQSISVVPLMAGSTSHYHWKTQYLNSVNSVCTEWLFSFEHKRF